MSASGTLNNFSYTLVDLLPNDGIAPSLSIVKPGYPHPQGTTAYGDFRQSGPEQVQEIDKDRTRSLYSRPLDVNIAVPGTTVASTVSGTDFQSLDLRADASTTRLAGHGRTAIASSSMMIEEFVLSPGTQVKFFADVNASVARSIKSTELMAESSKVMASMGFDGLLSSWYPNSSTEFKFSISDDSGLSYSTSERLWIMFDNTAATAYNLKLSIGLWSEVNALDNTPATSPVPEPATYGMMLAGLALVAGMARRKRAG